MGKYNGVNGLSTAKVIALDLNVPNELADEKERRAREIGAYKTLRHWQAKFRAVGVKDITDVDLTVSHPLTNDLVVLSFRQWKNSDPDDTHLRVVFGFIPDRPIRVENPL